MASFDLPQTSQAGVGPALLVGAVSPLWPYFGAAAASGMAYWWMTRWMRPVNLEAMLGRALPAPVAEAAGAVVDNTIEAVAEVVEAAPPAPVVGGEAAPVSPLLDAAPEPELEPEPEVMFAVAPEPIIEEPAPVALTAEPKLKAKKSVPPSPDIDA